MRICQNLNFDVARLCHEFFDKDTIIAKAVCRLVFRGLEAFARFLIIPRNPHAFTTTTGRCLDHDRISDLLADFHGLICILDQSHITRHG